MGAPREMRWVRQHLGELPDALIITCGGWFGFLTGREGRAPRMLRRPGLEWSRASRSRHVGSAAGTPADW